MSRPICRNIAFVGYNAHITSHALRQFAMDNADQVFCFDPYGKRIVLLDGTLIQGVDTRRCMDGRRIDQIIIADDARCRVFAHRTDLMAYLMCIRGKSNIPEEFAVQWYNLDAPAP